MGFEPLSTNLIHEVNSGSALSTLLQSTEFSTDICKSTSANEIASGLHVTVSTKGISILLHIDVIDDEGIRDSASASAFFLPERYKISKLYAPKEARGCPVASRCAVEKT